MTLAERIKELTEYLKNDMDFLILLSDNLTCLGAALDGRLESIAEDAVYNLEPLEKPYVDCAWYRMSDGYLVDLDSVWVSAQSYVKEMAAETKHDSMNGRIIDVVMCNREKFQRDIHKIREHNKETQEDNEEQVDSNGTVWKVRRMGGA